MNNREMEKALENMSMEEMEAAKYGVLPQSPMTEAEIEEEAWEDMWAAYEAEIARGEEEALAEAKAHASRKEKNSRRRKQSIAKTNRKRQIAQTVSGDKLGFYVKENGAIRHDAFDFKAVKRMGNKRCRQMDLPQYGGYKKAFKVSYCS